MKSANIHNSLTIQKRMLRMSGLEKKFWFYFSTTANILFLAIIESVEYSTEYMHSI